MDSVIGRHRRVAVLGMCLALAALVSSAPVDAKKAGVYEPPYKKGNQGGDQWNHINADHQTGEIEIFRVFPGFSPVVGCAPEPDAGWATLTQPHRVTGHVDKVIVNFDAMLEPYAWVYGVVWDARNDSLGLAKFQGPFSGAAALKIDLFRQPERGSTVTVEFGAQLGDSCPQVGAASVSFPSIEVR